MPKITEQRYDEIIIVLENSFLTAAAYDVLFDEAGSFLVKIKVKDHDQFLITLRLVTEHNVALRASRRTYLLSIESPGDFIEDEETEVSDFTEFLRRLGLWCERVKKALVRDDSVQRQLSELREKFEKELAAHAEDSNAAFHATGKTRPLRKNRRTRHQDSRPVFE